MALSSVSTPAQNDQPSGIEIRSRVRGVTLPRPSLAVHRYRLRSKSRLAGRRSAVPPQSSGVGPTAVIAVQELVEGLAVLASLSPAQRLGVNPQRIELAGF